MKLPVAVLAATLVYAPIALAQEAPPLDPKALQTALAGTVEGVQAERLADRVRQAFGGRDALLRGPAPIVDELLVAWAIEVPGWVAPANLSAPRVWKPMGNAGYAMTRIGTTDVYAVVRKLSHGTAFTWSYDLGNNRRVGGGNLEVYEVHPDSRVRPDVPKGILKQMPPWQSRIFPGTTRNWWVYVPAQYRAETPAAVMVWQDGNSQKNFVPTVMDNLIAKGDIPVTVNVFIEPGGVKAPRDNRSFEYDTLSDQYARFVLEEILPEVSKTVRLRTDAAGRAVAGESSGGICAFTVAWERPNEFSKVLSWIGSFVNIAAGTSLRDGGHNYEALVRRAPPKPIRIFMQDGMNDNDSTAGSWWLANVTLARSLGFAGYDYRFEQGQGWHNNGHLRAVLPDALRWLWR
jgi:enterochelin esterase-like enzyme